MTNKDIDALMSRLTEAVDANNTASTREAKLLALLLLGGALKNLNDIAAYCRSQMPDVSA